MDLLEYDNLERVWIERIQLEVRSGHRTVSESRFDLHVVRSSESGTVYEDTIDHLSESELVVTGLVFAPAEYLVHDVHEDVPFILLDSIEADDADGISRLIEYISEYTNYIVMALLEEDAAALDVERGYI